MSFFTSLSGLRNAQTDLQVVAHNIANAETVGFKKSSVQFADLVATGSSTDPRRSPGIGATIAGITQDFVLGPLEQTGRSLDLAIDGDGFFALSNPLSGDVSYTRNGNFRLTATGGLEDRQLRPISGRPELVERGSEAGVGARLVPDFKGNVKRC